MNFFDISEACKTGNVELLKKSKLNTFDTIHSNIACLFNQIAILNYLYDLNIFPNSKGREYAKKFKNDEVILWLNEKNL